MESLTRPCSGRSYLSMRAEAQAEGWMQLKVYDVYEHPAAKAGPTSLCKCVMRVFVGIGPCIKQGSTNHDISGQKSSGLPRSRRFTMLTHICLRYRRLEEGAGGGLCPGIEADFLTGLACGRMHCVFAPHGLPRHQEITVTGIYHLHKFTLQSSN